MDLGLSGKVALVTAASKVLGKATALQFARINIIDVTATEIERETGQQVLARAYRCYSSRR